MHQPEAELGSVIAGRKRVEIATTQTGVIDYYAILAAQKTEVIEKNPEFEELVVSTIDAFNEGQAHRIHSALPRGLVPFVLSTASLMNERYGHETWAFDLRTTRRTDRSTEQALVRFEQATHTGRRRPKSKEEERAVKSDMTALIVIEGYDDTLPIDLPRETREQLYRRQARLNEPLKDLFVPTLRVEVIAPQLGIADRLEEIARYQATLAIAREFDVPEEEILENMNRSGVTLPTEEDNLIQEALNRHGIDDVIPEDALPAEEIIPEELPDPKNF